MPKRAAHPILLWAAICQSPRSEWIHYGTVAGTRRDAKRLYLETWNPDYAADALKRVRFARVVVALQQP